MESYRIRDLHSPFFVEMRLWWTFYVCFYYSGNFITACSRRVSISLFGHSSLCTSCNSFWHEVYLYIEVVL